VEVAYGVVKELGLVHLAGKAIYQEAATTVLPVVVVRLGLFFECCVHGDLEEFEGDIRGDDLAVADVGANELAILRSRTVLLLAEEIASWKELSVGRY
jgi:hypothetical protein